MSDYYSFITFYVCSRFCYADSSPSATSGNGSVECSGNGSGIGSGNDSGNVNNSGNCRGTRSANGRATKVKMLALAANLQLVIAPKHKALHSRDTGHGL